MVQLCSLREKRHSDCRETKCNEPKGVFVHPPARYEMQQAIEGTYTHPALRAEINTPTGYGINFLRDFANNAS